MKIQNIYDDEMLYSVQLLLVVFLEWYSGDMTALSPLFFLNLRRKLYRILQILLSV